MKLIIASNNKGKISEFRKLLAPLGFEVFSQREAGLDVNPEETGKTFEDNAKIKVQAIYSILDNSKKDTYVLADDSGLVVDYLNGEPGIYSARYGGENLTDTQRCELLLENMKDCPEDKRTASFVCVLHFITNYGKSVTVSGECVGKIGYEPRGENGFGYDPVFYTGKLSFAQIPQEVKNTISHRAIAMKKFAEYLVKEEGINI